MTKNSISVRQKNLVQEIPKYNEEINRMVRVKHRDVVTSDSKSSVERWNLSVP